MRNSETRRERSNLLSLEQAWPIIGPHAEKLHDWLVDAWDWVQEILSQDDERRATLDESTVAAMVYDRFVFLMKSGLSGNKKICLHSIGRMVRVRFRGGDNGDAVLRLKKFDSRLRSRNIATLNQEKIYFQNFTFEGMADKPTNITFGYVTDLSGTSLKGVYLTCPISFARNKWSKQLSGIDDTGSLVYDPSRFGEPLFAPVLGKKKKAEGQWN
ncbi:hypothetical protein B7486_14090 [cyanobacterium TDX16]|nr:hypothetical protein B7486_14090 [cyanobacterium TDX16]